jgi:predicted DNA binding CopG/RHH family protein
VSRAKSAKTMPTSIRLDRETIQLLRVAAAIFGLPYQVYMRRVAIAHAEMTLNSLLPTMSVRGLDRKVVFDDNGQ